MSEHAEAMTAIVDFLRERYARFGPCQVTSKAIAKAAAEPLGMSLCQVSHIVWQICRFLEECEALEVFNTNGRGVTTFDVKARILGI